MTDIDVEVEVVFALPEQQSLFALRVPSGTTAIEAVRQSNIASYFTQIDLAHLSLGVYGKKIDADYVLQMHDRVEIYRPLLADPKEIRRRKALNATKAKGK